MDSQNNGLNNSFSLDGIDLNADFPEAITEWLANLYLLNEIPLNYLVPDKNMLPNESIRFFVLDRNWLKALTDGALSIGRNTSRDILVDNAALSGIHNSSYQATPMPRQKLMHNNHQRDTASKNLSPEDKLSGFLMNSTIVKYFNGLELKGFHDTRELQILRFQVLSERIVLCIFEGILTSVTFQEPSEALRFGTKDKERTLPVRKITGNDVGKPCGDHINLKVSDSKRVDIKAMVEDLTAALKLQTQSITSKELVLHLTCTADKCEINVK